MVCKLIPANCWESDSRRSFHHSPRGPTADASQYMVWIPTRWTGKGYRKLWFVKSTHCFLCVFFFFLKLYFVVQSLSRVLLFVTPWSQHTRPLCPLPSPRACSNSYPSSWWCHPTISSSAAPFSSCVQSSPASGSFLMSQLLASGGQNIGASASTLVLPMNIQGWLL